MKREGELSVTMPKGPTFAVLPMTQDETSPTGPRILQPSGWPMPKGYANGMTAEGRLVVTGGVIGWDVHGHLPPDFIAQVRQTLRNIAATLAAIGKDLDDVIRVGVYLTDMSQFGAMNEAYRRHFTEPYPARTAIGVAALPLGAAVEMDVMVG